MKKLSNLTLLYFILAFVSSTIAIAQKTAVEPVSKLQKIVVFTDKAMIVKEATFSLKKGENVVRISRLTSNLVDQSVQINLVGQPEIKISSVNVEETFLKNTEQPEIQKLQTELDELNYQIKEGSNQIAVINSSNEFLKRVDPFSQSQKVTTVEMEAHSKFLEKSLSTNYDRMVLIETKLLKMNEEKAALENELASLNPGKKKSKSIIINLLSANDKSGVSLNYSYISTAAGWSPQYEASAEISTSKIDFEYFALIWQSTGEDWSRANVEISTANPFVYGNPLELSAWYLDVYTPRQYSSKSAFGALEDLSAPRAAMQSEMPEGEPLFKETEIKEESTSFSFVLPQKADIVSDGQPHRFSIASSGKEVKYTWYSIPKLVPNAFLKASMKNPFSFPLMSGSMRVFFDHKLVGNSFINETLLPDGDLEISLGIDEGIKIERKLQKKFTDYAGVLKKETTTYYEYTIEITNGKSKEVTLDINDQFPISRNEKIKIEMEAPKGGDANVDEEGKISWKINLAPGAKKSIPLKFNIIYPKDMSVSGL